MKKMKQWSVKLIKFIWAYKITILTMIFLYLICHSFHSKHNNQFILLILSFLFLLAGLSKINKIIKWIVTVILALFITFDAYFGLILGEHLSFGMLDSILFTNATEAIGAFSNIWTTGILLFLGTLFLFILSLKELRKSGITKKVSFTIFAIYWLLYIPVYSLSRTYFDKNNIEIFEKAPAYSFYLNVGKKFPLIYHNAIIYATYREQAKEQMKYRTMKRTTPDFITLDANIEVPLKVYIVLGESATRNHFSLYGYSPKTTPFLESLAKTNQSFHYYNGISGAPLTIMAIPMAFTFATPLDEKPLYEHKNLLEIANDTGYETIWISSQAMLGMADSNTSVYSSVATHRHFLGIYPFDDILLVDVLKKELKEGDRQMFILHQEGSHLDYTDRYDEIDKKAINGSDIIADYDRIIHHTDRFLEQLFRTIEEDGSPYVLMYFSDHGEVVGKGHGFMNENISQFEIPFLIIQNGEFPIDSLVSKYLNEQTSLINNTSVINIITELIGYQFTVDEAAKVQNASKYIKHVDHEVYKYDELENKNK